MISFPSMHRKKQSLRAKLFGYMFMLAISLLIFLMFGVFLIGGFARTKTKISDTLNFQMEVFERQIETHFDNLSVMGIQLSDDANEVISEYLAENKIEFSDLNDSQQHIEGLQEALITPLQHKLWEADCTGAFIMLEATVNMDVEDADNSRTGLYLQRNSIESLDNGILLYRGLSTVGKKYNCMPHRKWRLEFSTKLFPNYNAIKYEAAIPLTASYRLTDVFLLPGTDQYVVLLTVPIFGKNGEFFGLCGFEINEAYFKKVFAQPSELDHAIFCLSNSEMGLLQNNKSLSAGINGEYYLEPKGSFEASDFGSGLTIYENAGSGSSYLGLGRQIALCPNKCTLFVCTLMPLEDYRRLAAANTISIIVLIIVFLLASGSMAFYFSHRYIKPLKNSIDKIKRKEYEHSADQSTDIIDLFAFLANQDRMNEAALAKAKQEHAAVLLTINQMRTEYEEVNQQVARLAYSRKNEVDPDDYENFKLGLKHLTPRENEVLSLYISGKSVKEIVELTGMREATVRFHNRNLYSKMGVHSLKQLLRYISILKQEEGDNSCDIDKLKL